MPGTTRLIQSLFVISPLFCCAPIPKYSSAIAAQNKPAPVINQQVLTKLKALKTETDTTGVLVIFRPVELDTKYRWPLKGTLWIDEVAVGDVFDEKYNILSLPAGRHSVLIRGTLRTLGVETATLIAVPAGQVTYLEITSKTDTMYPSLGFQARGTDDAVAACCTEGLNVDLSSKDGKPRYRDPTQTQL